MAIMSRQSAVPRTFSDRQMTSTGCSPEPDSSPFKEDTYLLVVKPDPLKQQSCTNGNNIIQLENRKQLREISPWENKKAAGSKRSISLGVIQGATFLPPMYVPSAPISCRSSDVSMASVSAVVGSEELHSPSENSFSMNSASGLKVTKDVKMKNVRVSLSSEKTGSRNIPKTKTSVVDANLKSGFRPAPPRQSQHDCRISGCERLRINVCGQHFETRRGVLDRHPATLLGDDLKRQKFYDRGRRELFFDRHRPSFEAIFAYYQHGGRLRRPLHVPNDVFLDELLFFELEEEAVEEYKRSEGYIVEESPMPEGRMLKTIWCLFEYPHSSVAAFIVAILSVMMTLVSIVLFCIETLPYFEDTHCVGDVAPNFVDPFFVIETVCTVWFTIEAIVRFIACPDKLEFWKDFKNIVDVLAVVPYYWTLFNVLYTMNCSSAKSSASLSFLRVIRLIRVFKLTKHSVGLQVLLLTFRASVEGLGLFLVALMVSLLVFSSAIYYAELSDPKTQMKSIPDAFWWAIITMTTVGYGDKVPVGMLGKVIGAGCAITGVLTLAIPVPIITGHFNRFYSHKTGRGRHI